MSSSNKLSNQHSNNELQAEIGKFIAYNKDEFAELVTFIDFAEKFTLGFIEINFLPDIDLLIAGLRQEPQCQEIQFVVLDFPDGDLRFLRDELVQQLAKIPKETNKKLVLLIRNLEKSIGVFGDYPPVLQDLNFIRDSYRQTVPYPLLFILPDYAISRLAKFAPDFWAWKSGLFRFKTTESTRDGAIANTLNADTNIERLPTPEQLFYLGNVSFDMRQFQQARDYYQQASDIFIEYGDRYSCASTYHNLGYVAEELREFEEARHNYQQALDICIEFGDRYNCAQTYHNLGSLTQNLREFEEARRNYQQALEIKTEYGDRYGCAATYFQLGQLAEELGEVEEATANYLQAVQITAEFNDDYRLEFSLRNLARFYQVTQDESLLTAVSEILGVSVEEVRQGFQD